MLFSKLDVDFKAGAGLVTILSVLVGLCLFGIGFLPRPLSFLLGAWIYYALGFAMSWRDIPWFGRSVFSLALLSAFLGGYHLKFDADWLELGIVTVALCVPFVLGFYRGLRAARHADA
ncbi:MAG: hypothetical protein Q7R88_01540 [bacterium]|nr:hypothetical protein [bacterium]